MRLVEPDLRCPGREKCLIYLTDPNECRECAGKIDGAPSALLTRLLALDDMRAAGCQFALGDLTAAEWLALSALREGRARIAAKEREE